MARIAFGHSQIFWFTENKPDSSCQRETMDGIVIVDCQITRTKEMDSIVPIQDPFLRQIKGWCRVTELTQETRRKDSEISIRWGGQEHGSRQEEHTSQSGHRARVAVREEESPDMRLESRSKQRELRKRTAATEIDIQRPLEKKRPPTSKLPPLVVTLSATCCFEES
jgi:hypothetical protein